MRLLMCRLCITFVVILAANHQAIADPDPIGLLKGVESAREKLHGTLIVTVNSIGIRPKKTTPRVIRLEISFDRAKRHVIHHEERHLFVRPAKPGEHPSPSERFEAIGKNSEQAVALGIARWEAVTTRVIYDATQVSQYSEQAGATIKDPIKGTSVLCFDPRVMGFSHFAQVTDTLESTLGYKSAQNVSIVGKEQIRGHTVWHVVVVRRPAKLEYHFWIEDQEGFRVHRYQYRANPPPKLAESNVTFDLYYEGKNNYPNRIEEHLIEPRQEYKVTFVVEKMDFTVKPDAKLFTLAGLDMPPGEMVADERISQVLGYWNGEGLSKEWSAAVKKSITINKTGNSWFSLWHLTGVVLLVSILSCIIWLVLRSKKKSSLS